MAAVGQIRPWCSIGADGTKSEVLDGRSSKSRPDRALIRVRTTTFNQNGEAMQNYTGNLLVPRRPADVRL
jgi:acyl dehydratase